MRDSLRLTYLFRFWDLRPPVRKAKPFGRKTVGRVVTRLTILARRSTRGLHQRPTDRDRARRMARRARLYVPPGAWFPVSVKLL